MGLILCDVDGVLADLHPTWLERYNRDWSDTLGVDAIETWDIHTFVKPECGKAIYRYLNESDLYEGVAAVEGALEGIEHLRSEGHQILYVTDCTPETIEGKRLWLKRHGFLHSDQEYRVERDKWKVAGDALIDDAPHNVTTYPGPTILMDRPWNRALDHPHRCQDWSEVIRAVATVLARSARRR